MNNKEQNGMTSRERVEAALRHAPVDAVPHDLGSSPVTGMHATSVYALRQALKLDSPGTAVRITNIFQMLGEIGPDLGQALGIDVEPLSGPSNSFGIPNSAWKEWDFWGTPVLVPADFNTEPESNGDILMYPQGDRSAAPSGRMPKGGFYFDAVPRQHPEDLDEPRVEDNCEEFRALDETVIAHYRREAQRLREKREERAVLLHLPGTGFGDVAHVPGTALPDPRGIRDVEEWYVSILTRPDFIREVFSRQCEVALDNLARVHAAVGELPTVIFMSGTDFGAQDNLLISPEVYRDLFFPFQKRLNDWVHAHTSWKTFLHTDGAVRALLPDFIEAGFDILNPVQWSAAGMELAALKRAFGERIVFWGGGPDVQDTLPFGNAEAVRREVAGSLQALKSHTGGHVFAGVHNIQAGVPIENLTAMYRELAQRRGSD